MKHILPLAIFVFIFSGSKAQTYFPLIDTASEWRDEWGTGGYDIDLVYMHEFSIGTDTFFNDYTYHKLIGYTQQINCNWNGWGCSWEVYTPHPYYEQYYLREDSLKHVFIATPYLEELLYDFNLHAGDTLPPSYINTEPNNYVLFVDSILIGSQFRKQFHIGNPSGWTEYPFASIIEGIGSTYGLLHPLYVPFETYNQLICFSHNGESTQFAEQFVDGIDDNMDDCDLINVDVNDFVNESLQFIVYPSPALDHLHISLPGFFGNGELKIISTSNRLVLQKNIMMNFGDIEENISFLPAGMYYILFYTEHTIFYQTIIKQ